jgi:hypothetical protein
MWMVVVVKEYVFWYDAAVSRAEYVISAVSTVTCKTISTVQGEHKDRNSID